MGMPHAGVTLTGFDELKTILSAMPGKVFKRCLVSASKKAMAPVVAQAKAAAAEETGALQKSIGVKMKIYKRTGTVVTIVGARSGFSTTSHGRHRDPAFYSHLVEGGHRVIAPHSLRTGFILGKRLRLSFGKRRGSGTILGRVQPRPFLRPALLENHAVIVTALQTQIGGFITKEAAKAKRAAFFAANPKGVLAGRNAAGQFLKRGA